MRRLFCGKSGLAPIVSDFRDRISDSQRREFVGFLSVENRYPIRADGPGSNDRRFSGAALSIVGNRCGAHETSQLDRLNEWRG